MLQRVGYCNKNNASEWLLKPHNKNKAEFLNREAFNKRGENE